MPQAVLKELVNGDFSGARRRAAWRRVARWLRGDPTSDRLLSFEEARHALGAVEEIHRGQRSVPVEKIVGTVGRQRDFDRAFLPVRGDLAERWKQADRILNRLEELAPVRLYKIGDAYFVAEGHFRISVAHYHGLRYVGAEVTEMRPLKDARVFAGAGPAIPTGAF